MDENVPAPPPWAVVTVSPLQKRVLIGSVAACLVAAVLGAAIIAGGGDDEQNVASRSTTTTVAGGADAGDSAAGTDASGPGGTTSDSTAPGEAGSPTTSRAGDAAAGRNSENGSTATTAGGGESPETTVAAAGEGFEDLGPADAPGTVTMPKPGTYNYDAKSADKTAQGSTKVEDKGDNGKGGRNLLLTITGQGFDSANDVSWGPDEMRIAKSTLSFGGRTAVCDWEPDHLELKLQLSAGLKWTSTSSCTISGLTPTPVIVKRESTTTVKESRRVRVAGQEVVVWVLEGAEKYDRGGQKSEATATTWFSPVHGMIVRSVTKSAQGSAELVIKNLDPQ